MRLARAIILRLLAAEQGATMPEYALMVALIAIAALLSVTAFGVALGARFEAIVDAFP